MQGHIHNGRIHLHYTVIDAADEHSLRPLPAEKPEIADFCHGPSTRIQNAVAVLPPCYGFVLSQ